jgi:hypothetical protein
MVRPVARCALLRKQTQGLIARPAGFARIRARVNVRFSFDAVKKTSSWLIEQTDLPQHFPNAAQVY